MGDHSHLTELLPQISAVYDMKSLLGFTQYGQIIKDQVSWAGAVVQWYSICLARS